MADDQPEGPDDGRYDWPIIAHADVENIDCDGCIWPAIRGDQAEITCNECGAVVRTVPTADLQRTYDEVELSLESLATEMCPFCGNVNVFPGWSSMMAYTCRGCGKAVRTSDDPNIEKLFGPNGAEK
jgi:hypothetical protein